MDESFTIDITHWKTERISVDSTGGGGTCGLAKASGKRRAECGGWRVGLEKITRGYAEDREKRGIARGVGKRNWVGWSVDCVERRGRAGLRSTKKKKNNNLNFL